MCSTEDLPQALAQLVDQLAACDAATFIDSAVVDGLAALMRQVDRLEAIASTWLAVMHERGLCNEDGSLSTQSWLARHLLMGRREAHRRVRTAVALRDLPGTRLAWLAGDVRRGHAEAIGRMADAYSAQAVASAEQNLLGVARSSDSEQFATSLRNARHALDQEQHAVDAQDAHDMRYLHASVTFEGMLRLDGLLDPESGAVVLAAIRALAAPEPDAQGPDPRSPKQRRADALTELCRRSLDAGLPEQAGERPHVNVVVPLRSLQPGLLAPPGDGALGATGAAAQLDGCEEALTHDQLRRLLCDSQVTRVVTNAESMPLDVGRASRTVTAAQRRALRIRDDCCRFPGCGRPFAWTDAHHIVHWADGGPTDLNNLISLCRRHHRHVHEAGWQVGSEGGGRFTWTDPAGRTVVEGRSARTTAALAASLPGP